MLRSTPQEGSCFYTLLLQDTEALKEEANAAQVKDSTSKVTVLRLPAFSQLWRSCMDAAPKGHGRTGWSAFLDNSIAVPYNATALDLNSPQSFPIPLVHDLTSWLLPGPASHHPMPSLVYVGSFLPQDTLDHDLYRKVLLVPPGCPFCVAVPPYMVVRAFWFCLPVAVSIILSELDGTHVPDRSPNLKRARDTS